MNAKYMNNLKCFAFKAVELVLLFIQIIHLDKHILYVLYFYQ